MASPTSLSLPEPAAAPEGLCSQCAAFDLDDALCFKPAIAVRIVLEIYQLKPKTCAFCRFLSGSMGHLPKGGMYNVTAVQAHFAVTPLLEKIEAPILCIEARRDWRIFNLFNIRSSSVPPSGCSTRRKRSVSAGSGVRSADDLLFSCGTDLANLGWTTWFLPRRYGRQTPGASALRGASDSRRLYRMSRRAPVRRS